MGQLAVYELRKIFCRKMVYVSLIFLIFFNIMSYFGAGPSREKVITTEGEVLEGVEAIRYMQEFDRRYEGELTEEKVEWICDFSYSPEVVEKAGGNFMSICPDILRYLDGASYAFDGADVEEWFTPEMGEIRLGYHKGYSMLMFCMMNLMLVTGCVIVIAVAPVFAEEYSRGTDALILTARYGKTREAGAKVAAAFLFSFLLCMAVIVINFILFFTVYGTEGWNTSVQVDFMRQNLEIPYEMNYGQLAGYGVLMWFVAGFLLTGITLMISAWCHTPFAAVIFAAACYVVPVWFSLPEWVGALMPAYQVMPQTVLNFGRIRVFGWNLMPLWIVVGVCAAAMVIFSIWSGKKFARRQVV